MLIFLVTISIGDVLVEKWTIALNILLLNYNSAANVNKK